MERKRRERKRDVFIYVCLSKTSFTLSFDMFHNFLDIFSKKNSPRGPTALRKLKGFI